MASAHSIITALISNIAENGRPIGTPRAGGRWHTDMCYAKTPARATMLYAVEVPTLHGLALGDTEFANAAAAWDALPEETQSKIEGRKATFDFRGRKRGRPINEETITQYPPIERPIVRTHPRTGRKGLYVMRDDCTDIAGLDDEEAQRPCLPHRPARVPLPAPLAGRRSYRLGQLHGVASCRYRLRPAATPPDVAHDC